jgi:hypothetical protein
LSRIFDAVRTAEKRRAPARKAVDAADTAGVVTAAVEGRVDADAPVATQVPERSGAAENSVAAPMQQQKIALPGVTRTAVRLSSVPAVPEVIPAAAIAVVGVTWEDDGAGRNPRRRLAEELKKQLTRVNFRHTDMRQATVYGSAAEDTATLQTLRKKYRIHGRFCEFIFLGATSLAACDQFKIHLKILEVIEREAIPDRAVVLLQEPYFPGV